MRIRYLHTEGFRLSAIYAGVFALSVIILGAVLLVITDQTFRDQILQFSRADIASVRDGYASEGIGEAGEVIRQRMAAPAASDFFLLQKDGRRIAGNLAPMTPRAGVVELPAGQTGHTHTVLGMGEFLAPGLFLFSGSDLSRLESAKSRMLRILVWLFAGALLLAVLGGALVSRSFLARTDAVTKACRAIMDGDFKARIPVRGTQDEMDRLAVTINEMLGRIDALMENVRQVTNDIAHDLRTPLTHLRHRLERARAECATPADYDHVLETATTKSDEILALFAALLRIAQIEGGSRRAEFAPVELASLLEHMRDMFGAVAEEAGHHLAVQAPDRAAIRGDRELLVQLFSNLIENAILHTPEGTRITLALQQRAGRAIITVSDDGPGVPQQEHDKLFRRLYRREASRTQPGYGLGLSVVAAIAELHGAKAAIVEQDGPGLSVAIAFPLSATA